MAVNLSPTFEEKSEIIPLVVNNQMAAFFLEILSNIKESSVLMSRQVVVENILKIFSKICYYTMDLFSFCMNTGLVTHVENLFKIVEGKDNAFNTYQSVAFELIYLVNSLLSFRKEPIPLLFKPY